MLNKQGDMMWSGLKWLRTGSSGELLWQWEWSDCSGNNSGKLTETNTERESEAHLSSF
jgi:hypothetical protein